MRVLSRESERSGPADTVLRDLEVGWLRRLFGERAQLLDGPPGEHWAVVSLGPLELALGFRRDAATPSRAGFKLVHGPFSPFRYDVEVRPAGERAIVSETVTLGLPGVYGGDGAARWVAARLFPRFREARA